MRHVIGRRLAHRRCRRNPRAREAIQCRQDRHLVSGCGSSGRARARRFLRWRKQQVGRNIKTGTQPLHHGHAQFLLSLQDFTDAARRSQDRHHVRTGETMLIHEVADEIRCAWWPTRPLAFLIGCDQSRLRLQPGNIGWLIRLPESFNKGAGAREFRIAIDQNQGCIHVRREQSWFPTRRPMKSRGSRRRASLPENASCPVHL